MALPPGSEPEGDDDFDDWLDEEEPEPGPDDFAPLEADWD